MLGLGAYAIVIVTTRYVMAFALAGTLTALATLSPARRIRPVLLLAGLAIPVLTESIDPLTAQGLAIVASLIGGMVAGVLVPPRFRLAWIVAVGLGLALARVLLPTSFPGVLFVGAVLLTLLLWKLSYVAIRRRRPVQFATAVQAALGVLLATVLLIRLGLRVGQDADALARAESPAWGNLQWNIARELQAHGVAPGTRIALIGPHAESYWVRTGRMHIVASVPRNRTDAFWELPRAQQDSLLYEFRESRGDRRHRIPRPGSGRARFVVDARAIPRVDQTAAPGGALGLRGWSQLGNPRAAEENLREIRTGDGRSPV